MKDSFKKAATILLLLIGLSSSYVFAQSYQTYAESSNIKTQPFYKNDKIWIISTAESFSWNRALEKDLLDAFSEKGVRAYITSDEFDLGTIEDISLILEQAIQTGCKFMLVVSPEELYTFSYGGGIQSLQSYARLQSLSTGSVVFIVELSTEADTNDFMSLNASKGPAIKSMANTLVTEYLKYTR